MHRITCHSQTARQLVVAEIQEQSSAAYRAHEEQRRQIRRRIVEASQLSKLEKALDVERKRVDDLVKKEIAPLAKAHESEISRLRKLKEQALFATSKELKPMYDELTGKKVHGKNRQGAA